MSVYAMRKKLEMIGAMVFSWPIGPEQGGRVACYLTT